MLELKPDACRRQDALWDDSHPLKEGTAATRWRRFIFQTIIACFGTKADNLERHKYAHLGDNVCRLGLKR